jgi:hypothetical protein
METATSAVTYVSPNATKYHPGVAKAWAMWSGTETATITALASYNIASIIKGGTGSYTIVLSTGFSSTAWAGLTNASSEESKINAGQTATSCVVVTSGSGGAVQDAPFVHFVAYGDHA